MNKPLKIIYIAGVGHSGSTLLDLLISSHSKITSVGEAKVLVSPFEVGASHILLTKRCTCGSPTILDCEFWQSVNNALLEKYKLSLDHLELSSSNHQTFRNHNIAFFDTVSAVSRCEYVVDSSKNPERLKKLLTVKEVTLFPIHIVRNPYGVVYSNVKKGRNWTLHANMYRQNTSTIKRLLRQRNCFHVHYDHLVRTSHHTLSNVMSWLGLTLEEGQCEWTSHEHHNISGNQMRFNTSNRIKLDVDWKHNLTPLQKIAIALLAFPHSNIRAILPQQFLDNITERGSMSAD
ncbi:sulfotransferase [candidate division CSSED10-310 bacterium]|uniref:Sulfotransferase n=1 Tax=candidate division CSSED10-310 bacterium TaxID=2855610 RepID=A0ABV6Z371_UNCC1